MADISQEYAQALFSLSKENNADWSEDLACVRQIFADNPSYVLLLSSPGIPLQERLDAVEQAFGQTVAEEVVSFLQLLCCRGDADQLEASVETYQQLMRQAERHSVAKVVSAVELTETEQSEIRAKLEKSTGHTVTLECTVDQTLLGGVIVYVDGQVLDGSLRRRLHDMKEVMNQ